jgi:hypothetical protein
MQSLQNLLILVIILVFITIINRLFPKDKTSEAEELKSIPEFKIVKSKDNLPDTHLYRIINKRTGEYAKTYSQAIKFNEMSYKTLKPINYQPPKIEENQKLTQKQLELYRYIMNQQLAKKYLTIFPFGLQFLFFDKNAESYAFEQFCKKYPTKINKITPIMHINLGKDTLYLTTDESFLYHQELDVVFEEFVKLNTCEEVWKTIIKPDIEAQLQVN